MPRELRPCGTEAAYRRHLARGERPCAPCMEAMRDARRSQKAKVVAKKLVSVKEKAETIPELNSEAILLEVLAQLRAQLAEAPPQAVASIAKGIRDTLDALEALNGGAKNEPVKAVNAIDEISARRQRRKDRFAGSSS